MAFALNKQGGPNKQAGSRKSPLAGLLGRKGQGGDGEIPELNVAAGLDRALKSTQTAVDAEQAAKQEEQANPVRDALSAIEAALYAIDRVRDILEQACEVAVSARDIDEVGGRAMLAESYDELRLSIDEALEKVDPRAAVLIGKNHRHLDVTLGGKARYSVSPVRLDIGEKGLNLPPPHDAFADTGEIEAVLEQLDKALSRADRAAASYCRDAQYLIARMRNAEEG